MQIVDSDGNTRTLEDYEIAAIEQARKEHYAGQGITPQYTAQEQQKRLLESLANQADIPAVEAVRMVDMYPEWTVGTEYPEGFRMRYSGYLWRSLQDHTAEATLPPTEAPALYAKVVANGEGEGAPAWNETITYAKGDRVEYNGETWVSTEPSNTSKPTVSGWTQVS